MDRLMDVMTQFVTMQMQPPDQELSGRRKQASSVKSAIARSGRSQSSEVESEDKGKGERMLPSQTQEQIHRAIEAIMHYKSQPDLPHDLK